MKQLRASLLMESILVQFARKLYMRGAVTMRTIHALQILFLIIVFWISARAELHKGEVLSILQYFLKSRLCVIRVAHNSPDK